MLFKPVLTGGHSEHEPPDSIPNSEVKLLSADDSVEGFHAKVGHCQSLNQKPCDIYISQGFFLYIFYRILACDSFLVFIMDKIFYALEGKRVVATKDYKKAHHCRNQKVSFDELGVVIISTIFTAVNLEPDSEGLPSVFETTVFGGDFDQSQKRYVSWDEAEVGHQQMVARIRKAGRL